MRAIRAALGRFSASRMSQGIAWTTGSFVILAISGIAINIIVAWLRGAEELGIFNQAYSVYIIVSQFAALGMHYSVLRSAAYHSGDRNELGQILISGCVPALIAGTAFALLVLLAEPMFAQLFSEPTARAITLAAFGLALFPLNKMLIAFVNGLREMRAFAILQASRYVVVASVVAVVSASSLPFEYASLCFFIAEGSTAVAAIGYILARRLVGAPQFSMAWLRTHLTFGSKSLFAGMFGEVNTRVDVLMLGVFLDDVAVGIYSFAAMLMDGLYHLVAMVRVNYTPVLVATLRDGDWPAAEKLLRTTRIWAPVVIGALSIMVIAFFWIVTTYVVPERGLQDGLGSLIILLGLLTLVSGYIPFDNLLLAGGHPGYQTAQQCFAVAANVLPNFLLIPVLDIAGAAVGTGCSYVASILLLIVLARRFFGWNLLTNKVVA